MPVRRRARSPLFRISSAFSPYSTTSLHPTCRPWFLTKVASDSRTPKSDSAIECQWLALTKARNAGAPISIPMRTKPTPDGRVFACNVFAIPEHGVSVVSDIDDTIKITEVSRKRRMFLNTLVKDARAVAGELCRGV